MEERATSSAHTKKVKRNENLSVFNRHTALLFNELTRNITFIKLPVILGTGPYATSTLTLAVVLLLLSMVMFFVFPRRRKLNP